MVDVEAPWRPCRPRLAIRSRPARPRNAALGRTCPHSISPASAWSRRRGSARARGEIAPEHGRAVRQQALVANVTPLHALSVAGRRGRGAGQIAAHGGPRAVLCRPDRGAAMEEDEEVRFETSKGVKVFTSFDQMSLKEELLRGLYAYGFEKPSAIQQRAVLPIVQGRDVIAQAQSGTGKSSMISVSTCQLVDISSRE